jgi:hypothetical protein
MLSKAGIQSIDDLANADPETLTRDLGLVGEILDLDYWITWARENPVL